MKTKESTTQKNDHNFFYRKWNFLPTCSTNRSANVNRRECSPPMHLIRKLNFTHTGMLHMGVVLNVATVLYIVTWLVWVKWSVWEYWAPSSLHTSVLTTTPDTTIPHIVPKFDSNRGIYGRKILPLLTCVQASWAARHVLRYRSTKMLVL